jgi:hypothetical protein
VPRGREPKPKAKAAKSQKKMFKFQQIIRMSHACCFCYFHLLPLRENKETRVFLFDERSRKDINFVGLNEYQEKKELRRHLLLAFFSTVHGYKLNVSGRDYASTI